MEETNSMKLKTLLLLSLSILFINCSKQEQEINYVILSGAIKNASIDSLRLSDKNYNKIKTIYLSDNHTFNDTLFIPEGYYQLSDWKSTETIFFKNKDQLNTIIKYNENDFLLLFEGIESPENNYLSKQKKFNEKFKKVENYKYYLYLDEEEFLKLADSIRIQKEVFLKSFSPLDSSFLNSENFVIEYNYADFIERYKNWRGEFLKDKNFKVSTNFPNPYTNINLSNENLLIHPDYTSAIQSALLYGRDTKSVKLDLQSYLDSIEKKIISQKIIDELTYSRTEFILKGNNKISESEYSKFMSMVKNENYRKEIDVAYQNIQKLSEGTVSPSFELYDINDRLVSLESLKGKLVYIDIWATWCIPCIKEIPALKIVEEEFKNEEIYFVSMCLKDSKENFEKMVKEKALGGVQLFAPNDEISFFKDYFLSTIPRFILIDKEGKIIDAYAYKPSDPELKELLLKNL